MRNPPVSRRMADDVEPVIVRRLFDLCHFRVEAATLIYVALIRSAEVTCAILHS